MKLEVFDKVKLSDVISWIIGFAGVVATIFATYKTEENGFGYILIGLFATEMILVLVWTWTLYERYKYNQNLEFAQQKIGQLETEKEGYIEKIRQQDIRVQSQIEEIHKHVGVIISNIKNTSKLNNDLCTRIPSITERSYRLLATLQDSGIEKMEVLKSEISNSVEDLENGLYDVYKRYSSQLLNNLVEIEESYLATKGLQNNVSATIKLFNEPYYSMGNNRNQTVVYTAFRDKKTYDKHEREIGEKKYSIDANIDFVQCLKKDQFIINNAKKNSGNYMNEHIDFDTYYNCTVVVSVRTKMADGNFKYFGYLCCECLNTQEAIEPFDIQAAQLLFALAQQYATFLNTLDNNWEDRVGKGELAGFSSIIYKKTFLTKSAGQVR